MKIPFVDSDIEDLLITDHPDGEEFGEDDEIYNLGFGAFEENEPNFDNVHSETTAASSVKSHDKIILAVMFLINSIILGYLIMEAKSTVFPQVNVEMASVYPLQFTSVPTPIPNVAVEYNVTAGWNVYFAVRNPSASHALSYSCLNATVSFRGKPTWAATIPGFDQAENGVDFLHANFDRKRAVRVDSHFAANLLKEISNNNGSVSGFEVGLSGEVKQKTKRKMEEHKWWKLRVFCEMKVEFLKRKEEEGGDLMALGTARECRNR